MTYNNYTYQLDYPNGKSYIGSRTYSQSKCKPEEDTKYLGSSKHTPKDITPIKTILGRWATAEDAVNHEVLLHDIFDVARNDKFYNKSKQTASGFSRAGVTGWCHSEETKRKMSENNGMKRPDVVQKVVRYGTDNPMYGKTGNLNPNYKGNVIATSLIDGSVLVLSGRYDMISKGFDQGHISKCLSGKLKTHKGYTFKREVNYV